MIPGEHLIVVGREEDAIATRLGGLQLRDTLLILLPNAQTLFAYLFRQPLEGTVAENVLKYGVGGLDIDGCRVGLVGIEDHRTSAGGEHLRAFRGDEPKTYGLKPGQLARQEDGLNPRYDPSGRWPTNLLLVHGPGCMRVGEKEVKAIRVGARDSNGREHSKYRFQGKGSGRHDIHYGFANEDGTKTVTAWSCQPDCPVRLLDEQSGDGQHLKNPDVRYGGNKDFSGCSSYHGSGVVTSRYFDAGGASRFYPQFASFPEALDWLTRLIGC